MIDVNELIEILKGLTPTSIMQAILLDKHRYVDVFGNYHGNPGINTTDEQLMMPSKNIETLKNELITWKRSSQHYQPGIPVHLIKSYDYDDDSYDLRHYPLIDVKIVDQIVVLIGAPQHVLSFHYEPPEMAAD